MSVRKRVLHRSLVLVLIAAATAAGTSSRPPLKVPGVGFSLTPNYGTAAIYFENGTSVDVARVEGSPAYKSFMRKNAEGTTIVDDTPGMSLLRTAFCPSLQPFYLEFCQSDADFDGARGLLQSLQSSVSYYLDTPFCFVGIATTDSTWQYQGRIIQKAVKSTGLRQTHQILDASRMALYINDIDSSDTPHDKSQAVLSVDYSASGLNAVLWAEDLGVADIIRRVYDQQLGADRQEEPGHLKAVKGLLAEFAKPPFGRDFEGIPITDEVQQIVLYGDAVTDAGFLKTLKAVVGSALVEQARTFNPVFSPAVGMAMASHIRMDDIDFDVEPAFGCRWRSRLYGAEADEL